VQLVEPPVVLAEQQRAARADVADGEGEGPGHAEEQEQWLGAPDRAFSNKKTQQIAQIEEVQSVTLYRLVPPISLSVVVPAYNEEWRLPALLAALDRELDSILAEVEMRLVEVVVVDDGSTDRTSEIVQSFDGLGGRLTLLRLPTNRGKGAAVRAGMLAARGERVLMTDADMSTPLEDIVSLAAALDSGQDVALGSRALAESQVLVHQPLVREVMGKGFNVLLRLAARVPWRDTQCGFKLFRRETTRALFEAQRIEGFAFDAEICVRARRLGLKLAEVPVRWSNDPETHVRLVRSSLRMALDVLRVAAIARSRPVDVPDPRVVGVGSTRDEETLSA
jgi:dolichyl-phosphate beta-glucosyltransferase